MAATTSSRAGASAGQTQQPPAPPVDNRDYVNPGIFVTSWPPVLLVEDQDLRQHVRNLPTVEVPWESLATLKVHAPDMSKDIIVCGWQGAADIIRRLEGLVLRDLRHGVRRK